jgi:methyltransferase (TIGR00027 family)
MERVKERSMRRGKVSRSAEGVATIRAVEAERPQAQRIVFDPYADALVPRGRLSSVSRWIIRSGLYEHIAPGTVGFIVGRERYVDDHLEAALAEGLDQVVVLGAGFDTRAFRIPGIERTRVFEIDQAATQAAKLERLKKVIDPLPGHVVFLPADLDTQPLREILRAGGYDERGKTLFIWQGVTYFLQPGGVDGTLAFIAGHSGSGSGVVFDYVYDEVLRDTTRGYGRTLARAGKMSGEPYVFGIGRAQVAPFLTRRGFCDVIDMPLEGLKPRYFTGPNASRRIDTGHIAIASARVRRDG